MDSLGRADVDVGDTIGNAHCGAKNTGMRCEITGCGAAGCCCLSVAVMRELIEDDRPEDSEPQKKRNCGRSTMELVRDSRTGSIWKGDMELMCCREEDEEAEEPLDADLSCCKGDCRNGFAMGRKLLVRILDERLRRNKPPRPIARIKPRMVAGICR